MSWITDWTGSLWEKAFEALRAPLDAWLKDRRAGAGMPDEPPETHQTNSWEEREVPFPAPVDEVFKTIGAFTSALQYASAKWFASVEGERLHAVKGASVFPPNTDGLGRLAAGRPDQQLFYEAIRYITGKTDDVLPAAFEAAKTVPGVNELRMLWNRGMIDEKYLTECFQELGYHNFTMRFKEDAEGNVIGFEEEPKLDRDNVLKLFEPLPDINSIVRMELRDTFPMRLANYPPEEQTELWQQWKAETEGHDPAIKDWKKDGTETLTDALKEGKDYGYQSYESWFLNARSRYSQAFEKAMSAHGVNKYWAMKLWESHWQLPGYAQLQELLYRSPMIDEGRMADILRWQDYPPGLVDEMVRVAFRPLTRVDVRRMHLRGVIGVPRVFQSYLAFGYNVDNAVRMTAFTVVWNVDRTYGDLIGEVLKSFGQGAVTFEEAVIQIWGLVGLDVPDVMPDWVQEELNAEQIEAVNRTYGEIRSQLEAWMGQQLSIANAKANIANHRARLDTAKKQFVSWEWTPGQTRDYLTRHGYSTARVQGLFAEWQPLREREERLPTRGMLEDFLVEQGMPVDTWKEYMARLGYSDVVILQILEGVGKLPTRNMLETFYVAEEISVDVFRSYMGRLGYDPWTIGQVLAILDKAKG